MERMEKISAFSCEKRVGFSEWRSVDGRDLRDGLSMNHDRVWKLPQIGMRYSGCSYIFFSW